MNRTELASFLPSLRRCTELGYPLSYRVYVSVQNWVSLFPTESNLATHITSIMCVWCEVGGRSVISCFLVILTDLTWYPVSDRVYFLRFHPSPPPHSPVDVSGVWLTFLASMHWAVGRVLEADRGGVLGVHSPPSSVDVSELGLPEGGAFRLRGTGAVRSGTERGVMSEGVGGTWRGMVPEDGKRMKRGLQKSGRGIEALVVSWRVWKKVGRTVGGIRGPELRSVL